MIAWIGLVIGSGFCLARGSDFSVDSLPDLWVLYETRSAERQAQIWEREVWKAQRLLAGAYPEPELGLEWGQRGGMGYAGLMVGQEFMFPGKRAAMQSMEEARWRLGVQEQKSRDLSATVRITRLVLDQYQMQEQLRLMDSLLLGMQRQLELSERLVARGFSESRGMAGMGMTTNGMPEFYRLRREISRLQAQRNSMEREWKSMRWMLAAAVGVDSLPVWEWRVERPPVWISSPDSLRDLVARHPAVLAMAEEEQMAKSRERASRLRRWPDLMVQGKYMRMMGENDWSVMASARFPIAPWSSSGERAERFSARAAAEVVRIRRAGMELMRWQEIREAYEVARNARLRLDESRSQVENVAAQMRVIESAVSSGTADLVQWLEAREMWWMEIENQVRVETDFYRALTRLEELCGVRPGTWLPLLRVRRR